MLIEVPHDEVALAVPEILGYPTVSAAGRLRRVLPWSMPEYDWLVATRVASIQGQKFRGKAGTDPDVFADYEHYLLSVIFTAPKYRVLSDQEADAAGGEWTRFVEFREKPGLEVLEIEKDSMIYSTGGTYDGTNFSRRWTRFIPKSDVEFVWHQVPHDFIYSPTTGRADNLRSALSCVNSSDWNNYPAGTLLVTDISIEPVTPAVDPAFLNARDPLNPNRTYTVTIRCKEFDPPRAPSGVTYPAGASGRGHNLAPAPQLATPWWYPVVTATGGQRIYPEFSYALMFAQPT
jgi:hypothetical protein